MNLTTPESDNIRSGQKDGVFTKSNAINVILNAASPKACRASGVKHALRSKIVSKGIPETRQLASKVRYPGFLATLGMTVETFVYPEQLSPLP